MSKPLIINKYFGSGPLSKLLAQARALTGLDEQVQALAVRAIETPATVEDLRSYLNGRINEINEVRVFGSSLASSDPGELGLSGYAVVEMLLNLQQNIV